jgi:hypothetical protein
VPCPWLALTQARMVKRRALPRTRCERRKRDDAEGIRIAWTPIVASFRADLATAMGLIVANTFDLHSFGHREHQRSTDYRRDHPRLPSDFAEGWPRSREIARAG